MKAEEDAVHLVCSQRHVTPRSGGELFPLFIFLFTMLTCVKIEFDDLQRNIVNDSTSPKTKPDN